VNKYKFSKREEQVARLLMEGKSNKQIAINLGISEGTVEFHLTSIYSKLGVSSRVEAIIHLGQPGLSLGNPEMANIGEIQDEKIANLGETPSELVVGNIYDEREQILPTKVNEMSGKKILFSRNYAILSILVTTLAIVVIIALYQYFSMSKTWKGYERESEYPDKSTIGQTIGRSNASGQLVLGQFGAVSVKPWSAMAGEVVYENISTPRIEQLYLTLRYSKNSSPSVPILIYLDDEKTPRASIYPENQKDWNRFSWTTAIFLGSVESGVHTIRFSTVGQQYGVVDLDKFMLTSESP